ncbi:aminotransferase class I/II-fold pyridoxal phosphate-dependent enzyme, partial [Oscillospiraceae bacterium OttesenSCG-928-F05]|nr:aminotransferase class I/II-fold pyridoxal phosphate-dependent enzyme [Oscillospiraceae bacterium OttesenSCG-928-F05]
MENITPLYRALADYAAGNPTRFHMPGHKGRRITELPLETLDVTELGATGDLYALSGPVREAERAATGAFGAADCFFLTGGATQGLLAMLALHCPPGSKILVDRNCHRAVLHGMVLLDLRPVFIYPKYNDRYGITISIEKSALEAALDAHPDSRALVVTSPTYYGVGLDIPGMATLCKQRKIPLLVDGAHGAHLPVFEGFCHPVAAGAALAVLSAHKTLPAL